MLRIRQGLRKKQHLRVRPRDSLSLCIRPTLRISTRTLRVSFKCKTIRKHDYEMKRRLWPQLYTNSMLTSDLFILTSPLLKMIIPNQLRFTNIISPTQDTTNMISETFRVHQDLSRTFNRSNNTKPFHHRSIIKVETNEKKQLDLSFLFVWPKTSRQTWATRDNNIIDLVFWSKPSCSISEYYREITTTYLFDYFSYSFKGE